MSDLLPQPLDSTDHPAIETKRKPPYFWRRRVWKGSGRWGRFAFANSATRREAKAILFQELAEAVRNGMPLDEALSCCMRSYREVDTARKSESKPQLFVRSSFSYDFLFSLGGLALILFGIAWIGDLGGVREVWPSFGYYLLILLVGLMLILLTSFWASDVERVARVLALRLLPLVEAGLISSAAMTKLPQDYSREEVAIINAGELSNNLSTAMDRLSQFQYYEREQQRHWNRMAYPVWLLFVMLVIIQFITIFIVPKFNDMYYQMNFELPKPTKVLINFGSHYAMIPFLVGVGAWFYILKLFMVGNRMVKNLAALITIICFEWIFLSLTILVGHDSFLSFMFSGFNFYPVVATVAVLAFLFATIFLMRLERMVLWIERRFGSLFGYIPVIGAPRQTERESRWLAGLSMGLASSVDTGKAMDTAGAIVGGSMGRRSARAAELVRGGHTIGSAVVDAKVLRPRYAQRLLLLDGRVGFVKGLTDIAEDAARESFHTLNRASRIAEVLSICLIGAMVFFFALALYLPLFNIPILFGTY